MIDLDLKLKSAAIEQLSVLIGDKNAEYMSRRIVTPDYNVFYAMLPDIINFIDLDKCFCHRTTLFCFTRWIFIT